MAGISETANSPLGSILRDGVEALDLKREVHFQAYTRVVLPIDGYIFWQPTTKLKTQGSLHFTQDMVQSEDETYGMGSVTFTAESKVMEFESQPPNTIYVGKVGDFRFAFSQQHGFYSEAKLWHYFGHSIAPALQAQLLDAPNQIDPSQAIVSNSMPFWLQLSNWAPPFADWFTNSIPLYPSFITPPNLIPAYGAVHIGAESTESLQPIPCLDVNRNSYQLCADRVRITLYGLQNKAAIQFLNAILQYSEFTQNFGIMTAPTIRDGKRPQPEIQAIAMQKVIELRVSYYQTRVDEVARQLITDALPIAFDFEGGFVPPMPPVPTDALLTETDEPILTETDQYILT